MVTKGIRLVGVGEDIRHTQTSFPVAERKHYTIFCFLLT